MSSIKELIERIAYIHDEFDSPALIEEYIEGREIYAAVLGNDPPEALPLDRARSVEAARRERRSIASYDVKFDESTEAYKKTKSAPARDLDEESSPRSSASPSPPSAPSSSATTPASTSASARTAAST